MGLQVEAGVVTPALIEGLNKGEASLTQPAAMLLLWVESVLQALPLQAPGPRQTWRRQLCAAAAVAAKLAAAAPQHCDTCPPSRLSAGGCQRCGRHHPRRLSRPHPAALPARPRPRRGR